MLSTKDEIKKMLDDIQEKGKSEEVKKIQYKDMSLDDLLDTIPPESTKAPEKIPDPPAEAEEIHTSSVIEHIRESSERYKSEVSEEPRISYEPEEIPFRNIFDEKPENISEEKKEAPEPDEAGFEDDTAKTESRKPVHAVTGVILLIFSLVGIICTFNYLIKYMQSFTRVESRQSEFAAAVYPAVIMDIEAFQNGNELSSKQIITASVWKLIMSGEIDKYEKTFDIISVPAVDIEAEAVKLFDTEFASLEHQTVGSGELKFYYNEETKVYNIPSEPLLFSYKPNVTALSKDGDIYTAEVEYIREKPSWMQNDSRYDTEASKVVKFRLKSDGDDYSILSMEIIKLNQTD